MYFTEQLRSTEIYNAAVYSSLTVYPPHRFLKSWFLVQSSLRDVEVDTVVMSLDSLFIEDGIVVDLTGVRQVIKHSVQQGLNTFVFQSAAH